MPIYYTTINPNVKKCFKCKNSKHISFFYKCSTAKDGYHPYCKNCHSIYSHKYRKRKKCGVKSRSYIRGGKRDRFGHSVAKIRSNRETRYQTFLNYIATKKCKDCKESNPIVFEFDHRNPKFKKFNIARIVAYVSFNKLLKEMKKCDIVCANCHKIRTAKRNNWRKLSFFENNV